MAVDWAERAGVAERAVTRRYVRRVARVLPGTRIGRACWSQRVPVPHLTWHYWWQAHLLDCLVDAQLRAPGQRRAATICGLTRGIWLRNGLSFRNRHYDDLAWLGLAAQRGGTLVGRPGRTAIAFVTAALHDGWNEAAGGGIQRRRGGDTNDGAFKAASVNGPAAILLARDGQHAFAAAIVDWMADTLVDPDSGLVRDGVRLDVRGEVRRVEPAIHTHNQGTYLGACVELAARDGHQRWTDRSIAIVDAVRHRLAGPSGVLPGSGGGDGGLFAGITARYLADAAVRVPPLREAVRELVLANADAVWKGRTELRDGPLFAAEWRDPAPILMPAIPETDLSVQLGAWMLLEAAARLP